MRRLLTIDRVAPAALMLFVFSAAVRPTVDNDLWWHLASGRWMVEQHAVIGPDPFSHTHAGVSRIAVDWLGQLVFYGTWSVGGLTLLSLLVGALAVVGLAFVYRACRGAVTTRVAVVALAAMASAIFWSDRPQMFSFALSGVTTWLLVMWRRDPTRRSIWLLVPIFALWANLHGAVVYGAVLVWGTVAGLVVNALMDKHDTVGRAWQSGDLKTLVGAAALSTPAMMLNPSGWFVFVAPFRQLQVNLPAIEEFQPPSGGDPATWPFFVMALAALAALVVMARSDPEGRWRIDAVDWILVLGTLLLALRVTRSIALFAVAAAPVVADGVESLLAKRSAGRVLDPADAPAARGVPPAVLGAVLVVAVLGAAVGVRTRLDHANADIDTSYPVAATAYLRAEVPQARLFNEYTWGGYLSWSAPGVLVSIDSRNDLYGEQLESYLTTIRAEGDWSAELDRERVDTVVIAPTTALTEALRHDPRWLLAFETAGSVVFRRVAALP